MWRFLEAVSTTYYYSSTTQLLEESRIRFNLRDSGQNEFLDKFWPRFFCQNVWSQLDQNGPYSVNSVHEIELSLRIVIIVYSTSIVHENLLNYSFYENSKSEVPTEILTNAYISKWLIYSEIRVKATIDLDVISDNWSHKKLSRAVEVSRHVAMDVVHCLQYELGKNHSLLFIVSASILQSLVQVLWLQYWIWSPLRLNEGGWVRPKHLYKVIFLPMILRCTSLSSVVGWHFAFLVGGDYIFRWY